MEEGVGGVGGVVMFTQGLGCLLLKIRTAAAQAAATGLNERSRGGGQIHFSVFLIS